MRVKVITPTAVVLDQEAVHVTAEDVTGSLGIRPGHVPLVTPLAVGIAMARAAGGSETYVAVNGGVMLVTDDVVEIVSRQAVVSDDLARLESEVLVEFAKVSAQDQENHVAFEKMRLSFMRRVLDIERAGERL